MASTDIATMVNLLNNISNSAQLDDTDPNNTVIQLFLSPSDEITYKEQSFIQYWNSSQAPSDNASLNETVTTMTWGTSGFVWASSSVGVTFNWCQGGLYS